MAKERNAYASEDFFSETDKLLEDIANAEEFINGMPTESAEAVNAELRKKSLEAIEQSVDQRLDGYVEVTTSDNEMQVTADFFPPSQGMAPLSPDGVAEVLNHRQITHGVDWELIKRTIFACNTEVEPVTNVVIAAGRTPLDEVPEHIEIEKQLPAKDSGRDTDKTRIDFKEKSPFVLVKEGDVIARIVEKKPGVMGFTVTGKSIPYRKTKITPLKPGKNTQEEGHACIASCDGRFEYDGNGFWVNELLEIQSDVDYRTGHIEFPGDVIIYGEIQDGFKVHAGGSIYCARTMDASEVICKKDVIVRQGIIGKRDGVLKTEGKVEAKFIENCYVEAKGAVSVEVGIINSSIHTLDRIDLGHRGVITGGVAFAQNGVAFTQLGSQSGAATAVHCGIDYSVEQRLEWIRDRNIQLAMKLSRVRDEIKRSTTVNPALIELRDKVQAAIHKMNEAAAGLVSHLDRNEDVEIIVRGDVFPGVYVEICHCSFIVNRKLSNVRFILNKAEGKVNVKPLSR